MQRLGVPKGVKLPAAHHIAIAAKYLCETADHNIGVRQDMHIEEIADRLVHNDGEHVLVGELSDSREVRGLKERITGEFAKEG